MHSSRAWSSRALLSTELARRASSSARCRIVRSLAAPPRRKQRSAVVRLLLWLNPRWCVAGGMPARSPASCALCKWCEASVGTPKDHHHTCLVCGRLRLRVADAAYEH